MVTSVQLGLRRGRRVDHIYDFSGGLLIQESVSRPESRFNPTLVSGKKGTLQFLFSNLVHPQVWLHKVSDGKSAMPDSGLL